MRDTDMKLKKTLALIIAVVVAIGLEGCISIPYSGQIEMVGESKKKANEESFAYYKSDLKAWRNSGRLITGTNDAIKVETVANNIRIAAEKWAAANGKSDYLEDFEWEVHLIKNDAWNAWCMPGGKMAAYTGLVSEVKSVDELAAIMGHEVAHALLLHGQRKRSVEGWPALIGTFFGGSFAIIPEGEEERRTTLPNSRAMEIEADKLGLTLMTIAGYDPNAAPALWERQAWSSDGTPEYFLTHPSESRRANNLRKEIPVAQSIAAKVKDGRPARQFLGKTLSIGGSAVYRMRDSNFLGGGEMGAGLDMFIDAKYIEANVTLFPAFERTSTYFSGGLVLKYPFDLSDKFTWFPVVGVGFENEDSADQKLDLGIKYGVAFDYAIVKQVFLRGGVDIMLLFPSKTTLISFFMGAGYAF